MLLQGFRFESFRKVLSLFEVNRKAYYNFIMFAWDFMKNQIPSLKTSDCVKKAYPFKIKTNNLLFVFERKICEASNQFRTYICGFIFHPKAQ